LEKLGVPKLKLYLVNKEKNGPPRKSSGFSSGFLAMQTQKNIRNHGVPFRIVLTIFRRILISREREFPKYSGNFKLTI